MIQLLGRNWLNLLSKTFFTDFRSDMLSILGDTLIISKLTNLQSNVKLLLLFKLSIIVNISDVSWTLHSIFKTLDYRHFSTKIDTFSTAVSQLPVITMTRFPSLWVLTKPYILPGVLFDGLINLLQESFKIPLSFHFSIQIITFISKSLEGLSFDSLKELLLSW